ncbi:hypothetical protein CRENBAI_010444, partial [Crenichthys baileyi]
MAEEHGMFKGLAPGERARGVKNNGRLLRPGRTSLLCQCCTSKLLSARKVVLSQTPTCLAVFPTFRSSPNRSGCHNGLEKKAGNASHAFLCARPGIERSARF